MTARVLISTVVSLIVLAAQSALPTGSKAPAWSLKDANDTAYDSSHFTGKTVLLIGGDKNSQDTNSAWASRAKSACGSELTGLGLADVSAVPKLLRGYYRSHLRADATRMGVPLLLDWDGSVAKSFHFKADVSNVFLIGPDNSIDYTASGPPTDEEIKQLCAAAGRLSAH